MFPRMRVRQMALLTLLGTGLVHAGDQQIERFIVVQGTASPMEAIVTDEQDQRITLGRSEGNDIVFAASTVSRQHATIVCTRHRCVIEDVGTEGKGSKNGTSVNGEALTPRQPFALRKDDRISLGPDAQVIAK